MKKTIFYVMLLLILPVLAACGPRDTAAVDEANENYDPGQQRLEEGNIQAVMDATKQQFSRDDVTFFTYRIRDGQLRMSIRVHNEEKEEEIIRTFADAFQNTEATTLLVEVKDRGEYNVPLDQDYTDLQQYFTPEE